MKGLITKLAHTPSGATSQQEQYKVFSNRTPEMKSHLDERDFPMTQLASKLSFELSPPAPNSQHPRECSNLSHWRVSPLGSSIRSRRPWNQWFAMYVHSVMSNSVIPWTVDHQSPLSMRFSRRESGWGGVAISFSRGSSQPRDGTRVSFVSLAGRFFPS